MKDGAVLQIGTPKQLLNHPEHDYVKKLVDTPRLRADRLERLLGD
jgi:ABC-type proline/glycine betaine transport system ATPase subunit